MVRKARESIRMQKLREEEDALMRAEKEAKERRAMQEQRKRAERRELEK